MATAQAQRKWREKNREEKSQLNVMARKVTHDGLKEISEAYGLNGKAEAVAFCTFIVRELAHKGEQDAATFLYLDALKAGFIRKRNIFSP